MQSTLSVIDDMYPKIALRKRPPELTEGRPARWERREARGTRRHRDRTRASGPEAPADAAVCGRHEHGAPGVNGSLKKLPKSNSRTQTPKNVCTALRLPRTNLRVPLSRTAMTATSAAVSVPSAVAPEAPARRLRGAAAAHSLPGLLRPVCCVGLCEHEARVESVLVPDAHRGPEDALRALRARRGGARRLGVV
eukprot:IDg1559t1